MTLEQYKSILDQSSASSWRYVRDGKVIFEVWKSGTKYRLSPGNPRFAQRVQRLVNYYPAGTRFKPNEEPTFSIPPERLREALVSLGVR
jgi:hypothetical protein